VAERTRLICRLRRHLHELDPEWEPKARSLGSKRTLTEVQKRLEDRSGVVARLARDLAERCVGLTISIKRLAQEITQLAEQLAPALLALPGCGPLTAAKIIGETAGVDRFKSRDAYARYNGMHPCQSRRRTRPDTDLAALETGNSTPHCTGSRSPKLAGIQAPRP
jgi:transposase